MYTGKLFKLSALVLLIVGTLVLAGCVAAAK
jgi:outer membrane murein-binding lipoprotein Lpp